MNIRTRIYLLAVVLAAVALIGLHWPMAELWDLSADGWEAFIAFTLVGMLSQAAAIDFGKGRQATSSMAFIPLLASAIVLPPAVAIVVTAAVIGFSEVVLTRRAWLKGAFNVAQLVIAVGLSANIYTWILDGSPRAAINAAGFIAMVVCLFSVNVVLSSIALSFFRAQPILPTLQEVVGPRGGNLLYDFFASPVVALTVVFYRGYGAWGILLIIVPMLVIRHFYLSRRKLEEANQDLLKALVKAIETRDPYTSGHSERVATLARLVAKDLRLQARVINRIWTAALLHDIGKIDPIFAEVLGKPYDLTDVERKLIQGHAIRGADLLRDMSSVDTEVVAVVRHHHERWDGLGYPDGLSGGAIPVGARIIMLCDSIDAMLSDRPYRAALSLDNVSAELERCSGSQFDPEIVKVMLRSQTLTKAVQLVEEWRTAAQISEVDSLAS